MLPLRKRWHNASKRAPEKEARLLWFAGTPTPDPNAAPDATAKGENPTPEESVDALEKPTEPTAEGVTKTMNETADQLHDTLKPKQNNENLEAQKPFYKSAAELAREVDSLFENLESILHGEDLREYIQSQGPDGVDAWQKTVDFVAKEKWRIEGHLLFAENMEQWLDGNVEEPMAFFATMRKAFEGEDGGEESMQKMQAAFEKHNDQIQHWDDLSQAEKRIIIDDVAQAGDLNKKLEAIEARMQIVKEVAEEHKKAMEIMHDFHAKEMREHEQHDSGHITIRGAIRGFFNDIGVEFYSPLEVWESFKLIQENWVKAYKEKSQLKTGVLAKDMMKLVKWAPYGPEVEMALDRDIDHKHGAASKEFAEHLEHEDETWTHLFSTGHSLLDDLITSGERDKATGVLEYAAKRGWLYDIDDNASFNVRDIHILGRRLLDIVPADWNETRTKNFFTLLRGQNMSGLNSEIENNTKKVQGIENTQYFIDEIDRELGHGNLWAAVGIAARAIDRGLKADVSPWIMMTVMSHLEKPGPVRKYASVIFIDKLGKLAAYRSSFTTGLFQNRRKDMMKWIKSGMPVDQAPLLGGIISKLRHDIGDACESTPTAKDMNRAVSLVMAAHLLNQEEVKEAGLTSIKLKPGRSISIYQKEYAFYRNDPNVINVNPQGPGIPKEDTDYWFQICENQYAGEQVFKELLKNDGRGSFTNEDRVPDFCGLMLKQYDDLNKAGKTDVAENFRREIGKKFTDVLTQTGLNDSRTAGMYLLTLRQHKTGQFMLKTLVEQGFFDINAVINAYWKKDQGQDLAKNLLGQIDQEAFNALTAERDSKEKKPGEFERIIARFGRKAKAPNWQTPSIQSTVITPAPANPKPTTQSNEPAKTTNQI